MLYTYAWWGLWTTCSNQELIGDFNSPEKKLIGGYHPKMQLKIRKAYETIDQTSMKK